VEARAVITLATPRPAALDAVSFATIAAGTAIRMMPGGCTYA
jgi:hypothetical protein